MSTERPLFRQSYAKTLLNECAALCKVQMETDRKQSRAMQAGSLLDYLVFGQSDRYEVVDAHYRSGARAGEPCTDWVGKEAQQGRADVRLRGLLAVLQCEVDEMQPRAEAIRKRIAALALEMAGGEAGHPFEVVYQPQMRWTSEQGVACRGEPDVGVIVTMRDMIKVCTIDVKHTAFLPVKKFNQQVYTMGWEIQGAAYAEGFAEHVRSEREGFVCHVDHVILASATIDLGLPPCARRLSPSYMAVGKKRWQKAQRVWQECLDSGIWPGYSEADAEPSHFVVRTEIEAFDPTNFAAEDIEP